MTATTATEMTGTILCGETTRLNHLIAQVPEEDTKIDPLATTEMTATAADHLSTTTTEMIIGRLVPPVVSTVYVPVRHFVSVERGVATT